MKARSTAASHWQGAVVAGARLYNAVKLEGASSNSTVSVEAFGDDTNIPIRVRGKGTGSVTLGNSSQSVVIGAGGAMKGFYSTTFAYAYGALSSGAFADLSIASTTADIMPGDLIGAIQLAASTDALAVMSVRTSTAAASRVTLVVGNIASTTFGSTGSGTGRISWIDLT